jgi:hypothetical protein
VNDFHVRFEDFLVNLAPLRQQRSADDERVRRVWYDALTFYVARGRKAASAGSQSKRRWHREPVAAHAAAGDDC